ncbi:hypothetical protein Micbo1qcDRAFT_236359 [Microdochium bolleyi]|uniref:Uncharacterized protein n=1 Tax=Microdochium bolleyi TaxID=196109 RepID=A0A136IR93_9PEZI|nr:hypothetical protein Micbo1qcDRAFT_236359 [Microdochium bolleyi]
MSQSSQPRAESASASTAPTLPPNISIYTGAAKPQLLSATLFTRLATTALEPSKLSAALREGGDSNGSGAVGSYCHQHHTAVLIFDGAASSTAGEKDSSQEEEEAAQDRHHEHFRDICLRLKDADIGVQYGRCVFDAGSAIAAGFQLDQLKSGDIMVVDLQQIEDDEDDSGDDKDKKGASDDEDDDSDIDLAALGDVVSGSLS